MKFHFAKLPILGEANTKTNHNMSDENEDKIDKIAKSALDWARGSWGQGQYDQPRFEHDKMSAIYTRIAQLAQRNAEWHSIQTQK